MKSISTYCTMFCYIFTGTTLVFIIGSLIFSLEIPIAFIALGGSVGWMLPELIKDYIKSRR